MPLRGAARGMKKKGGPPRAALYLRISREDEEKSGHSESILNQKDFLEEYCREQGFAVMGVYSDDGYSGTTFSRPAFGRLLQDVEKGGVDVVLTKDLSRLGRDYILTGHYIERYFPEHGVRYIAVNDQIDTGGDWAGNDMTPFRAVFNDLYAKDISKKVRTALDVKKRMGKFIGARPPYGYRRDPKDHNRLLPDWELAGRVEKIFLDILQGKTISEIVRQLNDAGVFAPSAVGKTVLPEGKIPAWSYTMVRRIATNPTYAGNLTQNRRRKLSYKVNKMLALPKEQWVTVPDTHEPIVRLEVFIRVQELLQNRAYTRAPEQEPRLLRGLVFCKDCKAAMYPMRQGPYRYLVCGGWKRRTPGCRHSHCIREDLLERAVLKKLGELVKEVDKAALISRYCQNKTKRSAQSTTLQKRQQVQQMLATAYLDRAAGVLCEESFADTRQRLYAQSEAMERLVVAPNENELQRECAKKWERLFDGKAGGGGLLLGLVEKILVQGGKQATLVLRAVGGSENNYRSQSENSIV